MHAPSYMLDRITSGFEIPRELLEEAFAPVRYNPTEKYRFRDNAMPVNIGANIRKIIIDGRVSTDLNLSTGTEVTIPLRGMPMEILDPWNVMYRIPKDATDGRSITHAYSVSYGNGSATSSYRANMNRSSPLLQAAGGVLLSNLALPKVSTAYVTLVEENTILVSDTNALPADVFLRCLLNHEQDFKNIQPSYFDRLGELAVMATKAYIWTTLIVPMDEGQIRAGQTLGRFREVVDSYSDSITMYKEMLRGQWRKSAYLNDKETMKRIWGFTTGGRR